MSEEEQFDNMIEDMFKEYCKDGFDFNTEQSLHDIFKKIFRDAVMATLNTLEEPE